MGSAGILEQHLEDYVTAHLVDSGFEEWQPNSYDKQTGLINDSLIQFIKESQPDKYKQLQEQYPLNTDKHIVQNISRSLNKNGCLFTFRNTYQDRGVKLRLYFSKPNNLKSEEHNNAFTKNKFSVIRQLQYSEKNSNEIDLVLFLNGIPLITAELKNSLTGQYVTDAIKQYKHDRNSKELLLTYKRCLVHFAVSTEKVAMTTELKDVNTFFMPFNTGIENQINEGGFKTEYLWKDVWSKNSLLDLIQNFAHVQEETERYFDVNTGRFKERKIERLIFPRFHQRRVIYRLINAIQVDGVGHNYLIKHSAGSGKSNTIAWLAHRLASFFHNDGDQDSMFDSIIVVTDRKILDKQLQKNITDFQQIDGTVTSIDDRKNSQDLKIAIESKKRIIITTLQKFPVISETISKFRNRKYAVIVDEAHGSQTGEASRKLRKSLSLNDALSEDLETEELDIDSIVSNLIATTGRQPNISFFAFTATPKPKTLEYFATRHNGKLLPFDEYTMEQAIKEEFILDVLENYTSFKRYYTLSKKNYVDDKEYETRKTIRLLNSYVDLQDNAIETKARIMLEHFVSKTQNEVQGLARAMVVTKSRLHAVRFKLKFDDLMREMNLPYGSLVAFSGTVYDKDLNLEFTENGMNGLGGGIAIPDALKIPQFRILIVANKFQTGYDEPLLHTMFVDKQLGGVNSVQTLSRLNRRAKGKSSTMILDFVNDPIQIQSDFKDYYGSIFMDEQNETDPNLLYDSQISLNAARIYSQAEVEKYARIFFSPKNNFELLQPILDEVVNSFNEQDDEKQEKFRSNCNDFVRLYRFLSQIITFKDVDLEKLYVFLTHLLKKLPKKENSLPEEVLNDVEMTSYKVQKQFESNISLTSGTMELFGMNRSDTHQQPDELIDLLTNIIQVLNKTYGLDLSDDNKKDLQVVQNQIENDDNLLSIFTVTNSKENIKDKFNEVLDDALLSFVNTKLELYNKLSEDKANDTLKRLMFNNMYDKRIRGIA